MDKDKFNEYYDNMHKVEEKLMVKRFNEYMDSNDGYKDANKPEIEMRFELFKCGWVTHAIESE